jgi:hypothetical protein
MSYGGSRMSEEAAEPLAPGAKAGGKKEPAPGAGAHAVPRAGWFRRLPLWKKLALIALAVGPVLVVALWIAVHSIPWMGPLVANSLRATIGKDNVTRLEEFVYSIEDRVNQTFKSGDKPKSYWAVPEKSAKVIPPAPKPAPSGATSAAEEKVELTPFAPPVPGPVHDTWSAEGDGQWVPVTDPRRPGEAPRMFKTLLHADSSRSWSELFVVAVDLRQVAVVPVMGYQEPRTDKKEAEGYKRPAKIPEAHYDALLAAFNGGFMAEHGKYGVYFDGILFLDPKDDACTLTKFKDGSFAVGTWTGMKARQNEMEWFRQAPACMYEGGEMHPNLRVHSARKWGATLDGNTVIRRSAVGLSQDQQILFVGISNHTTAKVMAHGMHHAGAHTVAQMDVNWSYPKFVTYEKRDDGLLYPIALAEGFEFSDKLYLRERSMRDFFYLARKEEIEVPPSEGAKGETPTASPAAAPAPSPQP